MNLTLSAGPGGEHSITVNGEGKSPSKANIYSLGEKSGLKKKDVTLIIDEITQILANWPKYAEKAEVSKETMKIIHNKISFILSTT